MASGTMCQYRDVWFGTTAFSMGAPQVLVLRSPARRSCGHLCEPWTPAQPPQASAQPPQASARAAAAVRGGRRGWMLDVLPPPQRCSDSVVSGASAVGDKGMGRWGLRIMMSTAVCPASGTRARPEHQLTGRKVCGW